MSDEELLREDRAARSAAQSEFVRPLVLEAGAGTGKTTTLVARVLAWCLGEGWERAAARLRERRVRAVAAGAVVESAGDDGDRVAAGVLSRVVAITFTEAAAAEMASRLAGDLAALASGDAVPRWLDTGALPAAERRRRRAGALLGTLDHLTVRTVHAFCLGLLTAHPLAAGRHPELAVDADGSELEAIVREVVEARLRAAYGEPGDPHLLALAGEGIGPPQLVEALAALAATGIPAAALAADPLAPDRVAALAGRVAASAAAVDGLLAASAATGGLGGGTALAPKVAAGVARLARSDSAPGDLTRLRELAAEALPPNLAARLKDWARGRLASRHEESALAGVRAPLAAAAEALYRLLGHLERLDGAKLDAARRSLSPLLAEVERLARSRGVETFQGLLDGAAELLADRPEVRAELRRGIDQLLVDEFQDTDRLQCQILRLLALDGPPEERPGLFLVGDPKQSIYGWRSADLAAYDGFVEAVEAAGGRKLRLVENFRSAPPILDEVERAVAPVMRARHRRQPPFVRLLPCAEHRDATGYVGLVGAGVRERRPVEHWVSWQRADGREPGGPRTPSSAATELEAAALAADLRELHAEGGVAWSEIGVLLRAMGDLDVYLEAFRRAGVPFRVGRDRQYYRRREVIEAAALVRAVLDPGDHLALLTVLRSPAVGVPDAALVPLWRRRFPQRMTELVRPHRHGLARLRRLIAAAAAEVPADAPGLDRIRGWESGLAAAVEQLAALRDAWARDPADRFVERLRRLFLVEPIAAARYLGAYRVANLDRFFRRLEAALDEGGGDGTAILRRLRAAVAEAPDEEEGRPGDAAAEAVSVLTIHGAKGLDFGHVYVVQTHRPPRPEQAGRTEVGPLPLPGERASAAVEYRLFGAPTLGFDVVEAERAATEGAERVRTLYVAMTRAKVRLVLAGIWPARDDCPPEQARSHAELLLARRDRPDVAALWDEAEASGGWAIERGEALWVFPALASGGAGGAADAETEPPPGTAEAIPALPSPAVVARQGAEIARRRTAAAARSARPFSTAASSEAHARLAELAERRFGGEGEGTGCTADLPAERSAPDDAERATAMAAGSAVHRALERWDFAAPADAERERQSARLPAYLAGIAEGEAAAAALARARDLLARFAAGPLPARLAAIAPHIVARELAVLLPPATEAGAVGFVSGAIDLFYAEGEGTGDLGSLVIVDYKTDVVVGDAALARRAAAYAAQGAIYRRALAEALGLSRPVRFELWFLAAGRVVEA